MDLPIFLLFGERPVVFERTADGGMDVRAFDWTSGAFVRDISYLSRYFAHEPEMEVLTEREFQDRVDRLRRERR